MQTGQIVKSRKGRDVETLYVVVGREGDRLFLADGKTRTRERPKRKNVRHVSLTNTCLEQNETDTDQSIKAALALYARQIEPR